MSDVGDHMTDLLKAAKTDRSKVSKAFDLATSMLHLGYQEGENMVFAIIGAGKDAPAELLDWALENFMKTRENRYQQHGYWVHSVSHFTKHLWEMRPEMDKWIKEINRVSFKGAIELEDPNFSDRLVRDFAVYARWDEEPADFHLTQENILWMDWEYHAYPKARIEHGRFASELEFVQWQIVQTSLHEEWSNNAQMDLIAVKRIKERIAKVVKLGGSASESKVFLRQLLNNKLEELKNQLVTAKEDWKKDRLQKAIKKTSADLATLS